jgi:hypothetical protein
MIMKKLAGRGFAFLDTRTFISALACLDPLRMNYASNSRKE